MNYLAFGNRVRLCRLKNDYTLQELASRTHYSPKHIGRTGMRPTQYRITDPVIQLPEHITGLPVAGQSSSIFLVSFHLSLF